MCDRTETGRRAAVEAAAASRAGHLAGPPTMPPLFPNVRGDQTAFEEGSSGGRPGPGVQAECTGGPVGQSGWAERELRVPSRWGKVAPLALLHPLAQPRP